LTNILFAEAPGGHDVIRDVVDGAEEGAALFTYQEANSEAFRPGSGIRVDDNLW